VPVANLFEIVLCLTSLFSRDIATAFLASANVIESADVEVCSPLVVEQVNALDTYGSDFFSFGNRFVIPAEYYAERISPSLSCVIYPLGPFFLNFYKCPSVTFYFTISSLEYLYEKEDWAQCGKVRRDGEYYFNVGISRGEYVFGMQPFSSVLFDSPLVIAPSIVEQRVQQAFPPIQFGDDVLVPQMLEQEDRVDETVYDRRERLGIDESDEEDEQDFPFDYSSFDAAN